MGCAHLGRETGAHNEDLAPKGGLPRPPQAEGALGPRLTGSGSSCRILLAVLLASTRVALRLGGCREKKYIEG